MRAGSIHITPILTVSAMPIPAAHVDDTLLDRCTDGDIFAFRELYEQWKRPLYSLAYRFHGNREDAEDTLQEAFVSMYRGIGSFRRDARFSSWMYRILMNACISSKRPKRSTERSMDFRDEATHPHNSNAGGDVLLRDILEEEIAGLPDLQKAVFILYAEKGLTHGEIADVLRISTGTSKSSYHRARTRLKERLALRGIHEIEVEA
ncbi:MAG: RNA polymerase sigma factor [Bacteroidota bacterium]|nr:RNA polymerase sigma factor [Bacteroidota bacterium]